MSQASRIACEIHTLRGSGHLGQREDLTRLCYGQQTCTAIHLHFRRGISKLALVFVIDIEDAQIFLLELPFQV